MQTSTTDIDDDYDRDMQRWEALELQLRDKAPELFALWLAIVRCAAGVTNPTAEERSAIVARFRELAGNDAADAIAASLLVRGAA